MGEPGVHIHFCRVWWGINDDNLRFYNKSLVTAAPSVHHFWSHDEWHVREQLPKPLIIALHVSARLLIGDLLKECPLTNRTKAQARWWLETPHIQIMDQSVDVAGWVDVGALTATYSGVVPNLVGPAAKVDCWVKWRTAAHTFLIEETIQHRRSFSTGGGLPWHSSRNCSNAMRWWLLGATRSDQ